MNGTHSGAPTHLEELNKQLKKVKYVAKFHEDELMSDPHVPTGLIPRLRSTMDDLQRVFAIRNLPAISKAIFKYVSGQGLDKQSLAQLVSSMASDSHTRKIFLEGQVKDKFERMLHPPVSYMGDAFQYRQADGRYNSAINPHLGQAGSPYAKSVQARTHQVGALPDAGDVFDKLMAREGKGRESASGLSSMLLCHATIVIHDIFRTNDNDKNISDTSSYLDLSPLYGFNEEMQRKVRDDKFKLGLLKPDTFAEDRLLRQSPGVCIYLVMYNRYHNYCARQLLQINENGRFSIPKKFEGSRLAAAARNFTPKDQQSTQFLTAVEEYEKAWKAHMINESSSDVQATLEKATGDLGRLFTPKSHDDLDAFYSAYDAAWTKLDDDLFNTARLITCGQFIQVSIHDYLKALMGLHQFDTDFTLDPRVAMTQAKNKNVSRGLGNQVTVEFSVLYRFHCAIALREEAYIEEYMREHFGKTGDKSWDPKKMELPEFLSLMGQARAKEKEKAKDKKPTEPWEQTFGLNSNHPELSFKRNPVTGLFDDQQMINEMNKVMSSPVGNFGPRNVPKSMKAIEVLGIAQARKWGVGTLNDFREFFGLERHRSFEDMTPNVDMQNALRDIYENVDKVELYPGVFCECDEKLGADPGPQNATSALWIAIFADAITLVRSDRFYTVDWNTHSLTSWGMKEVTPDPTVLKGSVMHRLFQRAFPGWYSPDSIMMFHPFYTPEANAKFAKAQGYAANFKMTETAKGFNTAASLPKKPAKPLYLTNFADIKALLSDKSDTIVHPARLRRENLPAKIAEVLKPRQEQSKSASQSKPIEVKRKALVEYFTDIMTGMIQRNCIAMGQEKPVYQIDVTKDFAIPVVTRYVAEFLGFGHLVESQTNPNAKYSENEIYRHITNCQLYLSYNSDETKMLQRRKAFQQSMTFLYNLTRAGKIHEANQWALTRFLLWPFSAKTNAVSELGFDIARRILEQDNAGVATAKLLIIALDSAYNNVLAFTSVLEHLIDEMYQVAGQSSDPKIDSCNWAQIQKLALDDSVESTRKIGEIVLKVQKASVKLPIIRHALSARDIHDKSGKKLFHVSEGQIIICDPYAAKDKNVAPVDFEEIAYPSNFTAGLDMYHSQELAVLSITAMVKTLAQLKNLRRGHDGQGKLKKIVQAPINEGYAAFMAPLRVEQIECKVKAAHKAHKDLSDVFTSDILKPSTDSYLTPEWDEMVPFPTTWKVRFEGFGVSDYATENYKVLRPAPLPDSLPPFYQPKGVSSTGGSFGASICSHPAVQSDKHKHVKVKGATAGCKIAVD